LSSIPDRSGNIGLWRRLAVLVLVIAAVGLPINDLYRYALLLLATVAIFVGTVSRDYVVWFAAVGVVALAIVGRTLFPAPLVEEGHNVFIVDGRGGALERELPAGAYQMMAAEFEATHPPERRCDPAVFGCWRGQGFPDRAFAFSADGIYQRAMFSRRVASIDFDDAVRLRLGFINDLDYNWTGPSDLRRGTRGRGLDRLLHPWRLTMPFFVMYRFPAAFAGSKLCWQGEVLWEGEGERFSRWHNRELSCRPIEHEDIGRRIFGVSIASPLAMNLEASIDIQLRRLIEPALALIAVAAVLMLLVRWRERQLTLPYALIGLALGAIVLNDSSFIAGVRPFDGGDDGLFYEGAGRRITQHLLAGNFAAALEGGEKVYYYGGPGLRYFRSLEHFIFGDSFLGYLSLVLVLPFVVLAVFRRFFAPSAALALTLVFIAIPIGAVFGSSFFHYAKWAARGFADPAAAIVFLAGFVVLVRGADIRFAPALGAGLLFALALWLRPNLAPGAAVLLGGAGLVSLWHGEFRRLAGLSIGFVPVFGMALHNWVFGNALVLFSGNITEPGNFPTPPSVYIAALGDLVRFDWAAGNIGRIVRQWIGWLSGPSESAVTVPLHAAAIAVLIQVVRSARCEFWPRLTAGAALALHAVALFYPPTDRYHYLAWFLTFLVCAVWMREEGFALLRRWLPDAMARLEHHPARATLARLLDGWA
jgi:hypothetical protein